MNKEILFSGVVIGKKTKVTGSLISNLFYKMNKEPAYYIIPNTIDYDCWEDIAEVADDYEVYAETVTQETFL